jgi:hypothetical protein
VVTFTAPAAGRVAGPVTTIATAPALTFTAPAATTRLAVAVTATAPVFAFTAPAAGRVAGAVTTTATPAILTVTAPAAVATLPPTTRAATANVVTFTAPAAARTVGAATTPAAAAVVTLTAPAAVGRFAQVAPGTPAVLTFTNGPAHELQPDDYWTRERERLRLLRLRRPFYRPARQYPLQVVAAWLWLTPTAIGRRITSTTPITVTATLDLTAGVDGRMVSVQDVAGDLALSVSVDAVPQLVINQYPEATVGPTLVLESDVQATTWNLHDRVRDNLHTLALMGEL